MGVFEGKSPAERNKIIAAIVLGTLAVASLIYTFGGVFLPGKSNSTTVADASPTATVTQNNATQNAQTQISIPDVAAINQDYVVTPVIYGGGIDAGPIGGRNIFAFYEPPGPTPIPPKTPTPSITPTPFKPPPTPTPPPILVSYVSPQSVYAGSKAFKLEVNGSKFTEDTKIVLNGTTLQTTFVNDQRLSATVSAAFIRNPGSGQIRVDTFDGKNFSNDVSFNIQAPPKPQVEYVGMQGKKHFNNDIAYFDEQGKKEPLGRRLNDIIGGRFRLISISEKEVEFEDVRLGFKHTVAMKRPDPADFVDSPRRPTRTPFRRGRRRGRGRTRSIPGIPDSIPRATPRPRRTATPKPNPRINNSKTKKPE